MSKKEVKKSKKDKYVYVAYYHSGGYCRIYSTLLSLWRENKELICYSISFLYKYRLYEMSFENANIRITKQIVHTIKSDIIDEVVNAEDLLY